jgi:protein-tyrosine-phosphatase
VRTVLFLCTGNYYRSRLAEILFDALAKSAGLRWRAASGGVAIELGFGNVGPLSDAAAESLAALGISTDGYLRLPRQVDEDDFLRADLIIALKEAEHRPLLRSRYPAWEERAEYWHIHDTDLASPE